MHRSTPTADGWRTYAGSSPWPPAADCWTKTTTGTSSSSGLLLAALHRRDSFGIVVGEDVTLAAEVCRERRDQRHDRGRAEDDQQALVERLRDQVREERLAGQCRRVGRR